MKSPLHILHVEDDPTDAALIKATLEAGGIACATVCEQNRAQFVAALERGGIDLILSDISLPAFDGVSALGIARTRWPDLPFLLVSGTVGEELAVDSFKAGATDYVLKGRLARLAPAVRRAMREVEARLEHRRLEAELIESKEREVLGQLAAGVAHDFNNILGVIIRHSEAIRAGLSPDSPLQKPNEEIRLASERAAGLARQLLVSGRKQAERTVAPGGTVPDRLGIQV